MRDCVGAEDTICWMQREIRHMFVTRKAVFKSNFQLQKGDFASLVDVRSSLLEFNFRL